MKLHEGDMPATKKGLRQDVRLPDERLRQRAHDRSVGAGWLQTKPTTCPKPICWSSIPAISVKRLLKRSIRNSVASARYGTSDAGPASRRRWPWPAVSRRPKAIEIINRAPIVDIVVGPQSYQSLPSMLFDVQREGRKIVKVDFPGGGQVRPAARSAAARA